MLEVTADSNIYVSALEFAGIPLRFLESARSGQFRLGVSDWILEEVSRTLRAKFLWADQRVTDAMEDIGEFTVRVHPTETVDAVPDDPDDNRILECAVAANSTYLVTGDGDLLRLGSYGGIRIVRVADFMKLLSLP